MRYEDARASMLEAEKDAKRYRALMDDETDPVLASKWEGLWKSCQKLAQGYGLLCDAIEEYAQFDSITERRVA